MWGLQFALSRDFRLQYQDYITRLGLARSIYKVLARNFTVRIMLFTVSNAHLRVMKVIYCKSRPLYGGMGVGITGWRMKGTS